MQYLASNILYLRKLKNHSQLQTAEQLQINPSTYRKWEKGQSQPKLSSLEKLINLYKRTLDELLYINYNRKIKMYTFSQSKCAEKITGLLDE